MMQMSKTLNCTPHKVEYWMKAYNLKQRTVSDAIYVLNHPNGDPFKVKKPTTLEEMYLTGLAIGLYWGEGTKADLHFIRLGNTDADLLRWFNKFLEEMFGLNKADFKFYLQIFTDINPDLAMSYWCRELTIKPTQFYKPIVTQSGKLGTYRHKSKYGVVTVNYNNKKLRDILVGMLPR